MITSYDRLAKIFTNCFGHMTKMAITTIYCKNPLNIFFSGTKSQIAWGLGMYDESRLALTYFMARSNLIPNTFVMLILL